MAYEQKQEGPQAPQNTKDDDKDILDHVRKGLKECIDEESAERAKMMDDLRFCTLDQWPAEIRTDREGDIENGPRPCLTIDKINQYIVQVVNDIRQGKPGINVRPQDDYADIETAKVLKGIIRNIEDQSSADIAYGTLAENIAKIGLGYLRITTEYVSDDSFDQEIFVRAIPNTFSVYLGKHTMPDGSDAEEGYIVESMPIAKFQTDYPKAKHAEKDFDGIDSSVAAYWRTGETITVVEYYCLESTNTTLYFLADGTTMTREDYEKWPAEMGMPPSIQDQRTTTKKQLKWRKVTAVEVLEKRDLPGKYIPIVECVGRESWVQGRRILWGLVRPAKDSLRMYNYFASTITEKMGLAPKTPWLLAEGQVEGLEHIWAKANRVNKPYLVYKAIDVNGASVPAPERVGPPAMEAALLKQMEVIEHDVQTSLGMFKAAVGETESQQSGRAILALQRESDTGTYHFGANVGLSIRHAGRIIVDMIPHYYDTKRIVRIMGEDGEVQTAQLDPEQDVAHRQIQTGNGLKSIYNPGVGKYDVSITVGPSYNTKRMEAAATFVELAKGAADPGSAAVLRYLTVQNSDFSGADVAARALKALLPPQVAAAIGPDPVPQLTAQIGQMQQAMAQMQEQGQKLQEENMKLRSGVAEAQIKAQVDGALEQQRIASEERESAREQRFAVWEARQEQLFARWEALLKATTEVEKAEIAAGATVKAQQISAAHQAVQ